MLTFLIFAYPAIINKIFKTNSSFYVKYGAPGKVQFLFLKSFAGIEKISF